ncbi:hypothetical protein V6N13_085025 [Hibiscus sabdariffa]
MASEKEPAKLILPYLQRADELQKHDPLVAYYCRLYAMEKGLKIPNGERTRTTNALLVSLMNQLEKCSMILVLCRIRSRPEDNLHLEGFALNIFAKADKQDRAVRADLSTAKTFYAASIFFEIINQFGPLQPDLEQKQKYAAWKAAVIRKALKEGRKPNPGLPNDDEDLSIPSSTHNDAYDLGSSKLPVTSPRQDSNPSSQFRDEINNHHSDSIPPPSQFLDKIDRQHSLDILPPPPSFPPDSYSSWDQSYPREPQKHIPSPPPANNSEEPTYPHSYHHQPCPQEPQPHLPHGFPSHDVPLHSYPNFQSYPSFSESSLPSAPAHYPSYYQGSETPYAPQSAPPTSSYPSTSQYSLTSRNETVSEPAPVMSRKYQYDSNYQPPPEKIAEAHKAAWFAVGALAFDDVSVAVEHLKKSLELLTNPSASQ